MSRLVKNYFLDQYCVKTTGGWNLSCTLTSGGGWHATPMEGYGEGSVTLNAMSGQQLGWVVYVRAEQDLRSQDLRRMRLLWSSPTGLQCAYTITDLSAQPGIMLQPPALTTLDITRVGLYEQQDWQYLLSLYEDHTLTLPWFAGPKTAV